MIPYPKAKNLTALERLLFEDLITVSFRLFLGCVFFCHRLATISVQMSVSHNDTTKRRMAARRRLDNIPDFSTVNSNIEFRQTFQMLGDFETITKEPREIVQTARSILSSERLYSFAQTVRDSVFYTFECSNIPLFDWSAVGVEEHPSSSSACLNLVQLFSMSVSFLALIMSSGF